MQIWLFFTPGTGGDGVANLLERAANVVPIDGIEDCWRIHRIVNGSTKFYAPLIDQLNCFRTRQRFDIGSNSLRQQYLDLVRKQLPIVITSHDTTLDWLSASDCHDILTHNQIKVLLHSQNHKQVAVNAATKNLLPTIVDRHMMVDHSKFDIVLDLDQVFGDWSYVDKFCQSLNLDLDQSEHTVFKEIVLGNVRHMSNNYNIEQYQADVVDNLVYYKKIGVWNPW